MDRDTVMQHLSVLTAREDVLAILLFGSQVTGRTHQHSDIDICVVAPDAEAAELMSTILQRINTEKHGYDIHIFEDFSLWMQHQVITDHEVLWCRDTKHLKEYFYQRRKLWADQAKARGIA